MDEFLELAVYIVIANVAYLIFSLIRQGFKHYSNYIAELLFLIILLFYLLRRGIGGGWTLLIGVVGLFILVFLPVILQKQIDGLMADSRFDEIEPFARLKAAVAWSFPNYHLHDISKIALEHFENPGKMIEKLKELLGREELYDGMTRLFIGLIHFNNRNYNDLINDIRVEGEFSKQTFEELLYLVRAYLETTRYPEAVQAQLVLERKIYEDKDCISERQATALVNRLVFYALMGWRREYEAFIESEKNNEDSLPDSLKRFWHGVCCFNSGDYDFGEEMMRNVVREMPEEQAIALEFMQKRMNGMIENKSFYDEKVLPTLKELHDNYASTMANTISTCEADNEVIVPETKATNIVAFIISLISVILIVVFNINDVVELVAMGANSSFLIKNGEFFRLVTYLFIHAGYMHLIMNIIALRYFGPAVETITGWQGFLLIFLLTGISGGALSAYNGTYLAIGASGAVLGLLGAAIVFEFFKIRGVDNFSSQSNFSTLMFILAVNLLFGFMEKGVDNSAHLGGFVAGVILGLIYMPVIKAGWLKKFASILSVLICLGIMGFTGWQMYSTYEMAGFYPDTIKVGPYKFCNVEPCCFGFEIPEGWSISEGADVQKQYINVNGPLREKLNIIVGANTDTHKDCLEKYISQRTNEYENEPDLELESLNGPDLVNIRNNSTYKLVWNITAYGRPLALEEYVIFEDNLVYFVRLIVSTIHHERYSEILQHCVKSIEFLENYK